MSAPNRPRNPYITSEDTYQRMLNCQPGDAFHEMFTLVVRVRRITPNQITVTEHCGVGPALKTRFFNTREDFAYCYSYKSDAMKGKSTLRWAACGFGHQQELLCICIPVDLLNNGYTCT
jgi:hypothetical protein